MWEAHAIAVANQTFDLENAIREAMEEREVDDLFSLSPLSSPEITPPSSPRLSTLDIGLAPPVTPSSMPTQLPVLEDLERASPANRLTSRKRRKKEQGHDHRRKKRREEREKDGCPKAREATRQKYGNLAVPQFTAANLQAAPVVKTGYTAPNRLKKEKPATLAVPGHQTCYTTLDRSKIEKRVYTLEEVVGVRSAWGLKLQKWDGK